MKKLKVLIPVDGTEFSEAIFPKLVPFAKPADTEILLLQVSALVSAPNISTPDSSKVKYSSAVAEANVRHSVRDEMLPEAEMLEALGYKVDREVGFGDPMQQILYFAELAKVDLIAMTTHGREGLSRLVSGSVAESVLHKAKVPVLMVRPEETPEETPEKIRVSMAQES